MILLTYQAVDGLALGVKTEKGIVDIKAAARALNADIPDTPDALYAQGLDALPALQTFIASLPESGAWLLDEAALIYGPCVPAPQKILCVGLNYRRHAAESGAKVPEVPVLFSKFSNALAAHGETISIPRGVVEIDYEVELVVVIGKPAKYIAEGAALDFVLGYCTANDVSARELQMRTSQWLLGKTSDKFCPLGPYLVTADEVGNPQTLSIKSWLNGELRQNSTTADMVFSVAQIISYASRYMTLLPGDVILTGTPEGVILGMKEKVWMQPGDEITVEVEKLGKLTNWLAAE
jgi:2-keto-4-pentenoate hydratase/2-oxohepta-3-ene-1,7-dioic acid hydratase in catechol pathway